MKLSFNNYDLLLLADWLEEYGSSYDIVKAAAIRNNNYNLNYKDNCQIGIDFGDGKNWEIGHEWGNGNGCGSGYGIGWGFGNCKI